MALKYTTVQNFWKFLGINNSVTNFRPGKTPAKETVVAQTVAEGDYFLNHPGVNEETLVLYAGSTILTITTHYTFDSDTSKVSVTSVGETALAGEDLTAEYEYCSLETELNYNETERILEQAERQIESQINGVFANQSEDNPSYKKIVDELQPGQGVTNSVYGTSYYPVVKMQTTVNGDYTTGGVTIDLNDASGFPSAGTIYIGGNKVAYTAKSTNTLTIPSTTPSISDGATVRGEVVEISTSPSGVSPSFSVLTPDSDYAIDYDTGEIQLMDEYYFQEDTHLINPQDGTLDRVKLSYMHAWHEPGQDATIPEEVDQIVYMIAGRQLVQRNIMKNLSGRRDNFSPQNLGFSKIDIESSLQRYRMYRVKNI